MELNLKDKKILISGATGGIGSSLVSSYLHEGAILYLVGRDITSLNKLKKISNKRIILLNYNCTIDSEVKSLADELKKSKVSLDCIISNIGDGTGSQAPLSEKNVWDKSWSINFESALNVARYLTPLLKGDDANIVMISSIAGINYLGAPTDYSIAKSSLITLCKNLSYKLSPQIRVNVVAPGNIIFENGSWDKKLKEDMESINAIIKNKVPLQRFGKPEEVASLVTFVSSEKAQFITGSVLVVDGGQTVNF